VPNYEDLEETQKIIKSQ